MTEAPSFILPLWAEIAVAFFALCGGLIALLGASGVLRLKTFFSRIHAPALITTAGIWCLMLATITYFSFQTGKPALNILLLGVFIAITSPVTTIFLMRAALFRSRQRGENVPRSVNMLQLATPKMAPEKDDDEEGAPSETEWQTETEASTPTSAGDAEKNQSPRSG
ncbi:Na+/H+ antiporter subunit G [Lampropedia puyangensis]|uniref:Na+/H+ antiporter subunit G n=1 Tax=Lampropedia puyangensis TaxID=1330072 RepID=A0A4S8EZA0_9BURK|nr:Na+/H+ antiporter subunit G [Lampropedia puyangensis]